MGHVLFCFRFFHLFTTCRVFLLTIITSWGLLADNNEPKLKRGFTHRLRVVGSLGIQDDTRQGKLKRAKIRAL